MKRHIVEYNYPKEEMEASIAREEAWKEFKYVDRVPVEFGIWTRFLLEARKVSYSDFFRSPQSNLYHQLLNHKWIVEHIRDDRNWLIPVIEPNFDSVICAGGLGAKIIFQDNEPPHSVPIINRIKDIDRYESPGPTDNLWGKAIKWYREMVEIKQYVDLIVNGEKKDFPILIGDTHSPLTMAIELVGVKFYGWLYEDPDKCHQLLQKITNALIGWKKYCHQLSGKYFPDVNGYLAGEDAGQMLSPEMFREFCLPYLEQMYNAFPGERGMHMCGQSTHLHQILVDELKIDYMAAGFGCEVNPETIAKTMGGNVRLVGNVSPVLIYTGPKEKIRRAAMHCLKTLAPFGGYKLCDGYNIAPGTPIENIRVLLESSKKFGLPMEKGKKE